VNQFQLISYPLFVTAALEILLGVILLRNNPARSRAQKAVVALAFFSAAFSLTTAIMYTRASLGLSLNLVARLNWIGWFTVPSALLIIFYLKDERSRLGTLVAFTLYPACLIIYGLCLFTDLIVMPGYSVIPFINHPGPLENPARLFGTLQAIWLLYSIIQYKKVLQGIKKTQFEYFLTGTLIFGGGAATTAGLMQIFGGFGFEPGLASFFSLPWVAFTYYAITRRRLFDIRIMFSRVISLVVLFVVSAVVQIGLYKLLTPQLDDEYAILISLAAIGGLFFGTRINRRVQNWVKRLVLQDRYDYQEVLKESSKAVISILDLNELLDYIMAVMKKSLGVESVSFLLQDGHGARTRVESIDHANDKVFSCLQKTGQVVVRSELERTSLDDQGLKVWAYMRQTGAELILPLAYKGEIKGCMVLGQKGNGDPYFQSDIDLLESLAGYAVVAIENARLYEEARNAKESMQESEAKFRTLAETAPTAIFMHQGGNFLYANRAAEVIGGYTVAEYLSMHYMGLVHPDYIDLVNKRSRSRLEGSDEAPVLREFKIVKKSGEVRWVLMTAGITEILGKTTVMATLLDISTRKKAEEERNLMAALIENSTDLISMTTMDGSMLFMNTGGRQLAGLENKEDVSTCTLPDFVMEEDLPILRKQILPALAKGSWRNEFRLKHHTTGVPIPVDLYAFTVADETTGRPVALATIMRDITSRKKAEDEQKRLYQKLQVALRSLQESEARFRTLAETTSAGIFIHRGGRFIYANPAIKRITGYDQEEFLKLDFWALVHPDYRELVRERGKARLHGESPPSEYEVKIVIKNGEDRWGNLNAGVIDFEGDPAVIVTFFDITDRKHAEEEQARLYEARITEEKQHVMEKEKILMDLHDGIGGITTNISILSEVGQKAADIESIKKTLSTISRLSREGISEIRGFMHSLDAQDLNWRTVATELRSQGINMVEPHRIAFDLEAVLCDVQAQPGSLFWVNLFKIYKEGLTNVIKHSQATAVSVLLKVMEDKVLLAVQDNGIGWDAERSRGRGLSNMKRRAAELGGNLTLSSGNGTRVSLEIPIPLKYPV